jgi:hypothetical protein
MHSDEGYSSVSVIILIFFLSAVTLGVLFYLQNSHKLSRSLDQYYSSQSQLDGEVFQLIEELAADPTPDADSVFDPVWSYLENRDNSEINLKLEDISSRFNLNFMRTKMIEQSSFKTLMTGGFSPDDLKQYRGSKGFFSDLNTGYDDFFEEEDLDKYFTSYGYANLNISYEDSLRKIFEIRVSDGNSDAFLSKIHQLILSNEMADTVKMKSMFGSDYDVLYPLINTLPVMNVNFVPEKVLYAVLNYPYGGEKHEDCLNFYEIIKSERTTFELENERLDQIFNLEGEYVRITQYLGTQTWFWKITATLDDQVLEVVLCRLPDDSIISDSIEYQILEWKYN